MIDLRAICEHPCVPQGQRLVAFPPAPRHPRVLMVRGSLLSRDRRAIAVPVDELEADLDAGVRRACHYLWPQLPVHVPWAGPRLALVRAVWRLASARAA